MDISIGIDPGAKGALGIIHDDGTASVFPLKCSIRNGSTIVDTVALREVLRDLIREDYATVAIEEPLSSAISSARTIASCWRNFGRIEAVMDGLRLEYRAVPPRVWQSAILGKVPKGESKAASIAAAKSAFPGLSLHRSPRCSTDCDGLADALNIARYLAGYASQSSSPDQPR